MSEIKMPKGRYYVGDPCYAVRDDLWIPLLDSCMTFLEPVGTVDEVRVVAFGTSFGDGTYRGSNGQEHGVDSGLIGAVPFEAVKRWRKLAEPGAKLWSELSFPKTWTLAYEDGVFDFGGQLTINTRDSEED